MLKKNKKGSALVVALFILAMILISALSITLITVKERLASIGSSGSNRAYQASETGIESVMQLIMKGNYDFINNSSLGVNNLYANLPAGISCNLSTGLLVGNGYKVQLLDSIPAQINCNNPSLPVSDIVKIKSVGESSNSKRAVEALVSNKNTKLLMHFNGEDPPIDSSYSYYGYSINNTGSVSFSNSNPVLDGTEYAEFFAGDYLKIEDNFLADGIDFNFLDKDFTIEAWIKPDITPANPKTNFTIVSQWDGNDKQFRFFYESRFLVANRKIGFQYYTGSATVLKESSLADLTTDGKWHHIAVERKDNYIYFFVDGVGKGKESIGTNKINDKTDKDVYIGASLDGSNPASFDPNYQFIGNMDELRITKGVARYPTSGFTPWRDVEYVPNI